MDFDIKNYFFLIFVLILLANLVRTFAHTGSQYCLGRPVLAFTIEHNTSHALALDVFIRASFTLVISAPVSLFSIDSANNLFVIAGIQSTPYCEVN